MKKFFVALFIGAASAQPVLAEEITLHCHGVSDMTIYNPHGNGGTAGGQDPQDWTIKTDGQSVWIGPDGSMVQATDVELNSSGLSFCAVKAGHHCDVVEQIGTNDIPITSMISHMSISGGTLHYAQNINDVNASMKTGVDIEGRGTCDPEGVAALQRLAQGEGTRNAPNAAENEAPAAPARNDTGDQRNSATSDVTGSGADQPRDTQNRAADAGAQSGSAEASTSPDRSENADQESFAALNARREQEEQARQAAEEEEHRANVAAERQRVEEGRRRAEEQAASSSASNQNAGGAIILDIYRPNTPVEAPPPSAPAPAPPSVASTTEYKPNFDPNFWFSDHGHCVPSANIRCDSNGIAHVTHSAHATPQ